MRRIISGDRPFLALEVLIKVRSPLPYLIDGTILITAHSRILTVWRTYIRYGEREFVKDCVSAIHALKGPPGEKSGRDEDAIDYGLA
jgi:hypothetical protein